MQEYFKKIYKDTQNNFYNLIKENIINENKMFIVTANPETFMTAQNNIDFKNALLDDKTTIIADGIGIVKGSKMLKYNIKETIPGVDLSAKLFEYCNELKKNIFLFGAKEDVLTKLVKVINTNYPDAIICGYENGYVENKDDVFNKMAELNPDVILIYNNLDKFKKGIFVGVGGSFDVLSGVKKRAPKIFRNLHLEWFYRLLKEPKRCKRFFSNNVKYIFKLKACKNRRKN